MGIEPNKNMKDKCVVLELAPLGGKKKESNYAQYIGSWSLSGSFFKISDEQPRPFYMQAKQALV